MTSARPAYREGRIVTSMADFQLFPFARPPPWVWNITSLHEAYKSKM